MNFLKGSIYFLTALMILSVFVIALHFLIPRTDFHAPLSDEYFKSTITLKYGDSVKTIARKLHEAKLLRKVSHFVKLHKSRGSDNTLKAGEYTFNSRMSISQVYDKLLEGSSAKRVLIQEGYPTAKIADVLFDNDLIASKEDFLAMCDDGLTSASSGISGVQSLQGFLYPDTYYFAPGMDTEYCVRKMTGNFVTRMREVLGDQFDKCFDEEKKVFDATSPIELKSPKQTLPFYDVLILASLIERESMYFDDKKKVASVFINRLNQRQRLECESTVRYTVGKWTGVLLKTDIQTKSPYNTHLNLGLPPTPICSPGAKSILAVIDHPKTDYMFYCLMNNGRHLFTKTYAQHEKAVAEYKKSVKQRKGSQQSVPFGDPAW